MEERKESVLSIINLFQRIDERPVVFSVENHLSSAGQSDPPLYLHAPWSRFVFYIIHDGRREKANVPAGDVEMMWRKSKLLIERDLFAQDTSKEEQPPCYTVAINAGKFKGKTPAEVLFSDPSLDKELYEQYKYLKANLAKYPKNKVQMDAIEAGIKLSQKGELKKPQNVTFDIYKKDIKVLGSNKDQQGRSLVYSIKISYTKTSDKKISVTIGNRFAFVKEDASGLIIPDLKTAGELNEKTIYLSCDEWYGVIQKMISQKIMFENAVFPGMMTKALKAYDQKFG